MNNFANIYNTISSKKATAIPSTARSSRGKYSFGIVCSERNGKRITLTASLARELKLDDTLFVTVYLEDGVVILSSRVLNENSIETNLKGSDSKISYNAGLVHFLIDAYGLDFSNRVCKTYHDIVFNNNPQDPMAILSFSKATAQETSAVECQEESDDEDYSVN